MCGFFLYIQRQQSELSIQDKTVNDLLRLGNEFIDPRGPSYSAYRLGQNFVAYQSVLAIQTLPSLLGTNSTPLESNTPFLYNGEIYSAAAATSTLSDTEYLEKKLRMNNLESFLSRCDGMFVLATLSISDNVLESCTLYRDLLGEKHLWFYEDGRRFLCSTTPGLIVAYLKKMGLDSINMSYVEDYFRYRHAIDPVNHFFIGIKQLPPGSKLLYKSISGAYNITNFASLEELIVPSILHERCASRVNHKVATTLAGALEKMEAVNSSHVSTAAIFSGGIDSSIVSALLGSFDKNIPTYTLCFEGKDTVSFSSSNMADSVSMSNKQLYVSVSDYYQSLIKCMYHLGSPVNSHSLPSSLILSQIIRRENHHVVYGGEGADEIYMGYPTYTDHNNLLSEYSGNFYKLPWTKSRQGKDSFLDDLLLTRYNHYYDLFVRLGLEGQAAIAKAKSLVDTEVQLPSVGLLSSDTITAISGVEGRTPFARHDVLSLGLSLDPSILINSTANTTPRLKYPLSTLFTSFFSESFLFPKEGYAGFPNECVSFLGPVKDWQTLSLLKIEPQNLPGLTRAQMWKVINVELFLSNVNSVMYR